MGDGMRVQELRIGGRRMVVKEVDMRVDRRYAEVRSCFVDREIRFCAAMGARARVRGEFDQASDPKHRLLIPRSFCASAGD